MTAVLRSRPALWFGLSAVLVFALELAVVRSAKFAAHPDVFGPAVAFDLAVFVPLLYWLLVARVGSGSWIAFFGVLTLVWGIAPFILPAPQRHYLSLLLVAGPIAEVASLGYAAVRLRRIVRAYRSWPGDAADVLARLRRAIVQGMGGSRLWLAVADELAMWRYAFRPPRAVPGTGFSYHRGSAWAAIVLALGIVGAAETAGVHLLVALWSPRFAWLLTFSSVYALLWLIADVRACARRPLLLEADGLLVRVGLRWTARVPFHLVAALEPVRPGKAPARRAPGYLRATPFGDPTLLLELSSEVVADGPYGIRRPVRTIGLAPDDAAAFTAGVRERMAIPATPGTA